jgi:hypothetical protein
MRVLLATAILGTALVTLAASSQRQGSEPSDSLERNFVVNGRVRMDLSAGDYRISGGPDNRIRMEWRTRDSDQMSRVRARADVRGTQADITTDAPRNSSFRVTIQVPARTDLDVRLTAGDLRVERVEGNKEINLHAGDINIDVGNPADYRRVEASIWAGDLRAEPFGQSKDGLFRSIEWNGKGAYRLSVHLKAGDLRLYQTLAEKQ